MEFAVALPILLLLVGGAVDLGQLYTDRIALDNAARVGVRWATLHPNSWTSDASPADNTIEGQIIYAGDTLYIPNDDAHITTQYYVYDSVSHTFTQCGQFHATTAPVGFQTMNGYEQSSCMAPGSFIKVTVKYSYRVLTPVFQGLFGLTTPVLAEATMLEQVGCGGGGDGEGGGSCGGDDHHDD